MVSIRQLLVASIVFASGCASQKTTEREVTVYSWPVSSTSPQELARIAFNSELNRTVISKFSAPSNTNDLVRVGLYDPKTTDWTGVVTSGSSFDTKFQQTIELHIDESSEVWHVGFAARPKPKLEPVKPTKGSKKGSQQVEVPQVVIQLVRPTPGPKPHLNQPVVLNPDGKVQEKEPEKTFLQKYWWVIGVFFLVQIVMGGGGGGEK